MSRRKQFGVLLLLIIILSGIVKLRIWDEQRRQMVAEIESVVESEQTFEGINRVDLLRATYSDDWQPQYPKHTQIGYPEVIAHLNKIQEQYKAESQRIQLEKWRNK